jgi:potassium-transporting ATPase KdpC subunit
MSIATKDRLLGRETARRSSESATPPAARVAADNTLRHLGTAVIFTVLSILLLGIVYPLLMTGIAHVLFPAQANGSLIEANGTLIGSDIVGQRFTKPQYFHGRPSAAGKNGYDPTATGGTNLGPTSKKLIDATRAAIVALRKENPQATGPIPMDLVTSSGSGIDPDISPEAALYQVPRVARARGLDPAELRRIVRAHVRPRELGFLGEPRVNVLELNRAVDALPRR